MTKASEIVEHMTIVFYGGDNSIDSLMRESLASNYSSTVTDSIKTGPNIHCWEVESYSVYVDVVDSLYSDFKGFSLTPNKPVSAPYFITFFKVK